MLKELITDEWLKKLSGGDNYRFHYDDYKFIIVSFNDFGPNNIIKWYVFMYEEGDDSNSVTLTRNLLYKHQLISLLNLVGWMKK